jgi:hypothetical protein
MVSFRRISNLFRRSRIDREIADELDAHIQMRIESNLAGGMSPDEARRDALLRFGNATSTRERVASVDAALALGSFWGDIRYAARQLRKAPGFTITVMASLAIGIGANIAVFSSMDAVVLRPLAVPALDRVVTVAEQQERGGNSAASLANLEDWERQAHSFEELAAYRGNDLTLTGAGDAAQVRATFISSGFFGALRMQTLFGRLFEPGEFQPGRDAVAVLSYRFWQSQFGSNPNVLGQRIELDQREYIVIGVLPRAMQYPAGTDL